jgi:hypothetical protein
MKLAVDRIVGDVAVCQDLETKMMFEIDLKTLDFTVHDGDIIELKDGHYVLNENLKKDRLETIKAKMNQAKNN